MFLGRKLTNRQVAAIAERWNAALRAASVGSVSTSHSGLAVADIAGVVRGKGNGASTRLARVKAAKTPEDFAALYTKDALKESGKTGGDMGGLGKDRAEARKAELASAIESQSEIEFATNKIKWAGPVKREWTTKLPGLDLRREVKIVPSNHPKLTLPDGSVIDDPDMFKCSWCDTYGHRSSLTFGKGPLIDTKITEIVIVDGTEVMQTRWVKSSHSMIACADHCLNLADHVVKYDRDGQPVYAGVKTTFPSRG